ncbi:hypothetical protein DN406_16145 [Bacillus sp. BB56-3]|nr:hypothetical protein DN406_16145 [Bacillus sp. BB56-3]
MQLILHPLGSSSKRFVLGMPTGEGASRDWEVGGAMFLLRSKELSLVVVWGRNPIFFCHAKHGLAPPISLAEPFHCVHGAQRNVTIQKRLLCQSNKTFGIVVVRS